MRKYYIFQEQVVSELVELGVPMRKGEVAVLDLKDIVITAFKDRRLPQDTARVMLSEVQRIYKY